MRELVDLVVTSSSALSLMLLSLKRCAGGGVPAYDGSRGTGLPAYAAGGGGAGGSFPAPHSSNNDTTAVSSGAAAH